MMPGRICVTGAVRGLASEGQRAVSLIGKLSPDIIAMSVSREGLETMMLPSGTEKTEAEPANVEEKVYIRGLSRFGEVIRPPPCFSMAVHEASRRNIPLKALDMDDEHYTAAYCKYISTFDMMRQGRSTKLFARHSFNSKTPQEFVLEWDRLVNRLSGYRNLERARERWFAKGTSRQAEKFSTILVIVDYERLAGLERNLKALGCVYERVD